MVVTSPTRRRAILIVVILVGILIRAILVWPRIGLPADDPDNYLPLAHSLAEGAGFEINGLPTAYRPPALPDRAGGDFAPIGESIQCDNCPLPRLSGGDHDGVDGAGRVSLGIVAGTRRLRGNAGGA